MISVKVCVRTLFVSFIGFLARYLLINCPYQRLIANSVEISTPTNSWKRAVEGIVLIQHGISPYKGDTFHEVPLFLYFYHYIYTHWKSWIPLIFSITDVLTGLFLSLTSYLQLIQIQKWEKGKLAQLKESDAKVLQIPTQSISKLSFRVFVIYLLQPYTILSCTGMSTSVFTNFIIAAILLTSSLGLRMLSTVLTAIIAYHSLYPAVLILPVIMIAEKVNHTNENEQFSFQNIRVLLSSIWTFASFLMLTIALIQLSCFLMGSTSFISSTYWFLLTVPDFTPNIGLFWYFFTEMFDQFRDFFLWTFQINSFIYFVPLSLILKDNPNFLFIISLILLSLFKPYPSVADAAIYIALLSQWSHLFVYLRQNMLVSCVFVSCSVLAPLMWHLWIILGTANSNYYFGTTLAYNTGQIFLMTDLLFAYMKRSYFLSNGIKLGEDGKPLRLQLVHD